MLYKNTIGVKKARQSRKHQLLFFCMRLKGMISGRDQGLLRFTHFVDAAIYNHVQTNSNNICSQTIETSTTKRTNVRLWSTFMQ